jgi:hypothetical protein
VSPDMADLLGGHSPSSGGGRGSATQLRGIPVEKFLSGWRTLSEFGRAETANAEPTPKETH